MNAKRAHELGLIGEVVPQAKLLERAFQLSEQIMANSPAAMARTKRIIWESLNHGLDEARELGWKSIEAHINHPDVREGAVAFAERRKPQWAPPTPEMP
jgi:enoyl-CoA hydratase/carnithine racemase